eukprot:m.157363 g.157363  ORF g.157363 m.157363 type:complete len:180 (+) comp14464_c0_seq1:318-857(+)
MWCGRSEWHLGTPDLESRADAVAVGNTGVIYTGDWYTNTSLFYMIHCCRNPRMPTSVEQFTETATFSVNTLDPIQRLMSASSSASTKLFLRLQVAQFSVCLQCDGAVQKHSSTFNRGAWTHAVRSVDHSPAISLHSLSSSWLCGPSTSIGASQRALKPVTRPPMPCRHRLGLTVFQHDN